MSDHEALPRREFARHLMTGLGAATLSTAVAADDEPPREPPSPEMLLLTTLLTQYPSEHYTEEIVQNLYRDFTADLARSSQIRAFPLTNGDGPAHVFRVFRQPTEGTP